MKLSPANTIAAAILIATAGFLVGKFTSPGSTDAPDPSDPRNPSLRSSSRSANSADHSAASSKRTAHPDSSRGSSATDKLTRLEAIVRGENALDRN
ncbi:MAG: hypothetical protein WCJ66_05505, partial [Verrucomicrobiota bacterium]